MKESVIYVLRSGNRILCEWRELDGMRRHCVPGGSVEDCDRRGEDYVLAAAAREVQEELGIVPEHCQKLDEFISNRTRFHVVLVDRWTGSVPVANRDNQNELHWVPLHTLLPAISLAPLKRTIERLAPLQVSSNGVNP